MSPEQITKPYDQWTEEEFLSKVIQRNTDPDGTEIDPGLLRRMKHPYCQECHAQYKAKFGAKPRPFNIVCDGVYDDEDFRYYSNQTGLSYETIRENLDASYWASMHVVLTDNNGNQQPFVARWYQDRMLRCTARRKVDRLGRGMGKTVLGGIEELHTALTRKRYEVLIITPAKSQVTIWFDSIIGMINADIELAEAKKSDKRSPYFKIVFHNDSVLNLFTAGSDSGKQAKSVRSQSPRKVRIDEQDYLEEADYNAIMPLLRRFTDSEFHGSSTPTGAQSRYWQMCKILDDYKEFHYPITCHPDWGPEMEEYCRREAKTEENYLHEWMAEFTSVKDGVFKSQHIEAAYGLYAYCDCPGEVHLPTCPSPYNPECEYIIGVDWNGQGTGTRIRVVERPKIGGRLRCVAAVKIDAERWTNQAALNTIARINRLFHAKRLYLDFGYGHVQEEQLRLQGLQARFNSGNPDDARLMELREVDFGASLETNSLVKRGSEHQKDRRTKPFLVENAVIYFEQKNIEFSRDDDLLDNQLREYRVKKYSMHGYANVYEAGPSGDHDLDALMLALLGFEMEYGSEFRTDVYPVTMSYSQGDLLHPSRQVQMPASRTTINGPNAAQIKINKMGSGNMFSQPSAIVSPQRGLRTSSGPGDRTAAFRKNGRSGGMRGILRSPLPGAPSMRPL